MDEIATRPDEFGCGISSSQATGFGDYSKFPGLNKDDLGELGELKNQLPYHIDNTV